MSSQYEHLPARLNKENSLTNGAPPQHLSNPAILSFHRSAPYNYRGQWGFHRKHLSTAAKRPYTGLYGCYWVLPLPVCRVCFCLSGASFPLRVLKWMRGGSRVSQSNKKRETLMLNVSLLIATVSCPFTLYPLRIPYWPPVWDIPQTTRPSFVDNLGNLWTWSTFFFVSICILP